MAEAAEDILARPQEMVTKPIHIDPAFADPQFVIDAIKRSSPMRNIYYVEGFEQGEFDPCFRAYWPWRGEPLAPELAPILHNPIFIEASKQSFDAQVVRPQRIVVNLNIPGGPQPAHMDQPTFRGIGTHPDWLSNIMGWSGLFRRWEVQISSALCWFYRGEGGEFRYWPYGPDAPAHSVTAPFWNVGLVSDNEYMFHQACGLGSPEDYLEPGSVSPECQMEYDPKGFWHLMDKGKVAKTYAEDKVRYAILWKAHVFKDEKAAAVFDSHSDDLDYDRITDMLLADMRARGIACEKPADPLNDLEWRALLFKTYPIYPAPADAETLG